MTADPQSERPFHLITTFEKSVGGWKVGVASIGIRNEPGMAITELLSVFTELDGCFAEYLTRLAQKYSGADTDKPNVHRNAATGSSTKSGNYPTGFHSSSRRLIWSDGPFDRGLF